MYRVVLSGTRKTRWSSDFPQDNVRRDKRKFQEYVTTTRRHVPLSVACRVCVGYIEICMITEGANEFKLGSWFAREFLASASRMRAVAGVNRPKR